MASKRIRHWTSLILVFTFVIGLTFPAAATSAKAAAGLTDISDHWAKDKITQWVQKGLVSGYTDGTFKPDKSITRAEFVTLVNKVLGFSEKAIIEFSDVTPTDWFYEEIAKAVKAGYISGYQDGTVKPNREISRQEAAVALCKALNLEIQGDVTEFTDKDAIPNWSRPYIAALAAKGYMGGYPDGSFKAERHITRAETVTMLDKVLETLQISYDVSGVYGPEEGIETISQDVAVNVPGVTLRNMIIEGNLYLNEGIGEGDATLDNVTVKGITTVRGGGKDSIHLVNFTGEEIIVIKVGGKVRIVASGNTKVGELKLESGAHIEGNGIVSVTVLKSGEDVILDGAFENVIIEAKAKIEVLKGTIINNLKVNSKSDINLADGATVKDLTIEAPATITGKGTIEAAKINADGAKLETEPKKVELAKGVAVEIAGKEVKEDKTSSKSGGGGDGGGGGSDKPEIIKVQSVSLDKSSVTLAVYESVYYQNSVTLTATIEPDNATNKKVTWKSSNNGVATVTGNGLNATVNAVSKGQATITVTTDDGGKTATCTVTVTEVVTEPTTTEVEYTATGEITDITPDTVTYAEGKFTVPEGVTEFTFKDGGKEMKATYAEGSWSFTEVVTEPTPIAANFVSTGNVGIAPDDTAGEAAGKIYAEYKLVAGSEDISLAASNVEYIKVKVGEGEWKELTANTDATLWFNVEAETGERTFEVKTKGEDAKVYVATLDWDKEIKTATWEATDREGNHEGVTYVEYKMMDGENPVSLKIDEVKLIASKDKDNGKWVALEANTDETLWFNKAKEAGDYEFFVVTSEDTMYKATLDWRGKDVYDALKAINDYLTPDSYVYAEAPGALEGHLATLGLQVGEGSDYAKLDKTAADGKNRKTAVFYDLHKNKPEQGYDLATLTTYFNDMVATRLVTEQSMDLVNNAEKIEDLDGISFVTMLLDRFESVSYQAHSDIPVTEKIATLQGLVNRYNGLDEACQKAVLAKIIENRPEGGYARSQATTEALYEALTEVETGKCVVNITQCKSYNTIQQAINEAAEGDTIVIAAGTFTESLTIDKTLTILGVNANKDPRTEGLWTDESVVTGGIRITGGDVTLKGLTIKEKGILASNITGLTVINNKITNISQAQAEAPAGSIIGLDVMTQATGPIVIRQNVFSDIGQENSTGTAIRMVKAADSITIADNIIENVTKNGINLYTNCLANENAKLTITGNEIINWDSDKDVAAIGGRAIRLEFNGADVTANAEITGNKLIPPVYDAGKNPVDPEYVKLTMVNILVDLTKNYWGSPKPNFETILLVAGDKASECAYVPYYTDADMTILGPPVINSTQGKGYDTIQAAVTAAAEGDTIVIAAGTFTEAITITDKSLTIQGTEGTILTAGIVATATANSNKSLTVSNITFNTRNLEVDGYDTVTISDNTFNDITTFTKVEGVIAADAIYVYGSNTGTVTIEGNTISGVRDDTNYPGDGIGITIHDYDNITIDDNTISDTYHNSINLYRGIAGEVKITNNIFSNWDSNQDKAGDTLIAAGCEGGRALRLALDSTATLTVTGNTFIPNDNKEPVDDYYYVKITGYNESKVDTLIASLVNSNTWPDGVDYSKAILVNETPGQTSTTEPDEDESDALGAEPEVAVSIFNEAKQEAIDEEEIEEAEDAVEETEDPANEQEIEDDEEIVDEQVDTEEDMENGDNGLEDELDVAGEEDVA